MSSPSRTPDLPMADRIALAGEFLGAAVRFPAGPALAAPVEGVCPPVPAMDGPGGRDVAALVDTVVLTGGLFRRHVVRRADHARFR